MADRTVCTEDCNLWRGWPQTLFTTQLYLKGGQQEENHQCVIAQKSRLQNDALLKTAHHKCGKAASKAAGHSRTDQENINYKSGIPLHV
jgi:hypothetical protein